MVKESDSPTTPPKTRLLQIGHELRVASPPVIAGEMKGRDRPLNLSALAGKPMKGMKAEPDAFWQSVQ